MTNRDNPLINSEVLAPFSESVNSEKITHKSLQMQEGAHQEDAVPMDLGKNLHYQREGEID